MKALEEEEKRPPVHKAEQSVPCSLPVSRVKKLFEQGKERGDTRITKKGLKALAIATVRETSPKELFIKEITLSASELAKEKKRKAVKLEDLERLSKEDLRYRFLKGSRFLENVREIEAEIKARAEKQFLKEAEEIEKEQLEEEGGDQE